MIASFVGRDRERRTGLIASFVGRDRERRSGVEKIEALAPVRLWPEWMSETYYVFFAKADVLS